MKSLIALIALFFVDAVQSQTPIVTQTVVTAYNIQGADFLNPDQSTDGQSMFDLKYLRFTDTGFNISGITKPTLQVGQQLGFVFTLTSTPNLGVGINNDGLRTQIFRSAVTSGETANNSPSGRTQVNPQPTYFYEAANNKVFAYSDTLSAALLSAWDSPAQPLSLGFYGGTSGPYDFPVNLTPSTSQLAVITTVPEPSIFVLLFGGSSLLLFQSRRKRESA